jgi:protein gp37
MGQKTGIAWCKHTFNMIWGCTKISEGCARCYAETLARRFGFDVWGDKPRRTFGEKHWNEPFKWDRDAQKAGERRSVFADSMCDVFERLPESHPSYRHVEVARAKLFKVVKRTSNLDWLLVTKRTENIASMLPDDWGNGYPNVYLIATVESQSQTRRIPELLAVPAVVHALSCEPLLSQVDLTHIRHGESEINALTGKVSTPNDAMITGWGAHYGNKIDWVIAGGESGDGFRAMDLDWARDLRDQCVKANVPFFFKQESGVHPNKVSPLLDGRLWQELPLSTRKQVLKPTDQTRQLGIAGWEVTKVVGKFPDGSRDVIVRNPADQTELGPYSVWLSDIIESEP